MHDIPYFLPALYCLGGLVTIGLCWVYDRLVLGLQGYYDEEPVTAVGNLLIFAIWPFILLTRTIAFPWQLWVAYQAWRSRNSE